MLCSLALVAPLLLGAPSLLVVSSSPPHPEAIALEDAYQELVDDYEDSLEVHQEALSETKDRKLRRELRKAHPAYEFFPRFSTLAAGGEGRALIWMIGEARYSGEKSKEQRRLKAKWCEQLVEDYRGEEWFEEAVPVLVRQRSALGSERRRELLEKVAEGATADLARAAACYHLGTILSASKNEEERRAGLSWFERLLSEHSKSSYAREASFAYNRARYLQVGVEARDFEAKTVDGDSFRLSDYRGKVVVLDFWGFW